MADFHWNVGLEEVTTPLVSPRDRRLDGRMVDDGSDPAAATALIPIISFPFAAVYRAIGHRPESMVTRRQLS